MLRIHVCSRSIGKICGVTRLKDKLMLIVRCLFFVFLILLLFISVFVSSFFKGHKPECEIFPNNSVREIFVNISGGG